MTACVFYCAGCVKENQAAVPSLKAVWCVWLRVLQEELGLPLVSMSPRDIVLGRRKIILSLVYQLMR